MKVAVYTSWSKNIQELADLTNMNHWQYCNRHGYDYHPHEIDYSEAQKLGLSPVRHLLDFYDVVFAIGADALFMNQRIKIEPILDSVGDIVMARETHGWWPINNDVVLFASTQQTKDFCDRITRDYEIWSKYQWLWQTHVWNLIQDEPEISRAIRLVHPKIMNCTPIPGESQWQLGDFIIHFLGLPADHKLKLAEHYLQFAGEPTFYK